MASTLVDSNNTDRSGTRQTSVFDNDDSLYLWGQQIKYSEGYTLTSVKLMLCRESHFVLTLDPGTIEVSIYATNGSNQPTGSALGSKTYAADGLPDGDDDDPPFEWVEFAFSPSISIAANTTYAIVLGFSGGAPAGVDLRYISWWRNRYFYLNGVYINGASTYPTQPIDSDWVEPGLGYDFLFETWGTVTVGPGGVPPAPYPPARPDDYDPDVVWDPIAGAWVDPSALTTAGGGRYHRQVVAVGHKKLYYGDL